MDKETARRRLREYLNAESAILAGQAYTIFILNVLTLILLNVGWYFFETPTDTAIFKMLSAQYVLQLVIFCEIFERRR